MKTNNNKALKKVWFLDIMTAPKAVKDSAGDIWRQRDDIGNGSILAVDLNELFHKYGDTAITQYVLQQEPNMSPDEMIALYYWW